MDAVVQRVSGYVAQYSEISESLPGRNLPWLKKMREKALAKFSAGGFPSPREEEWKYTNVSPIERKLFKPAPGDANSEWLNRMLGFPHPGPLPKGEGDKVLRDFILKDAWSLVFVDGRFSPALSALEDLPEGVVATGMGDALARYPERIRKLLGSAAGREEHGFLHFNTAYFSDGAFVSIARNTALDKPVQLIHVATRPEALATTRSLIVAEAGAKGKVVETYVGGADLSYLTAAVTEIFVGENAHLELYKLQTEGEKAFHFGGVYVKQERCSLFRHHSFSFGGLLVRSEVHVDLDHAADCALNGLYLGNKRQHVDNHTRINHLKPYGISREVYKGILDQRARGVFQGRVIVHPGALKTDSDMSNRNLLLSVDAEADTKPQLEIYADDVKCSHGVTVGQLEEKSVFYLQSRGIDPATARNMLTFAFANEMVEKIDLEGLRALVLAQLLALFPQKDIRKEWL